MQSAANDCFEPKPEVCQSFLFAYPFCADAIRSEPNHAPLRRSYSDDSTLSSLRFGS